MPEQAEWQPDNDNSGDYRWHPHYARRWTVDAAPTQYDTRTLADKVEELQAELRTLRTLVAMVVEL